MPRLLIVDDNESIHKDFKKVLTPSGANKLRSVEMELFGAEDPDIEDEAPPIAYDIDDAFQGEEAIQMADQAAAGGKPYSLVFMDVRMPPGMDGIKAAAEIWRRHPDTEMIICSAHSDYSWSDMLKEIGATDKLQFLRKPFDMVTVQQLALSSSKKWELEQTTKRHIKELEVEIRQKEDAQAKLAALNDELESRIKRRTIELEDANKELKDLLQSLKETQAQLVDAEKMAALGGLVAGVAHEINTPVGVAVTAASHLENKTRNLDGLFSSGKMKKSDLVQYLKTSGEAASMILSNLNRASELIQSFKKVAVDQSSEDSRRFKVTEYIQEVLLSLRPKLKKTQIELQVEGDSSLEVVSYPGALGQIISNFVMNSLIHAYGPDQTGRITIETVQQDHNLMLIYRDDGSGINENNLKQIFDPFYTTRRGQGGSGLGLHIVYNIVTQTLKGTIDCRSKPGKGTEFTILVPLDSNEDVHD